jgi:hypothetical protein
MTDQNLMADIQDDQVTVDPNRNYLEELVGEGKKFKSPEELARGKFVADQYVEFLKKGRDELRNDYMKLRDDYNARAKLEELIDQLNKPQSSRDDTLNANENVKQQAYDPKEIESLVSSKIQEHELTRKQEDNFNSVKAKLEQRYGENYKNVVKQQINELGITESDLNDMARRTPKVLLRTLGLDQEPGREGFQAPVRTQRQDNFAPSTQKRTWAFYEKLRKEDPRAYHDTKTQVQMWEDAAALGDEFKDGNYHSLN